MFDEPRIEGNEVVATVPGDPDAGRAGEESIRRAQDQLAGDGPLLTFDKVITIRGRARDVIIRGGENIYPAEVEDALLQHPAIADVAIVGMPDHRWGEVPVACYRAAPGCALDP